MEIKFYTEQFLTPEVKEVLRVAVRDVFPGGARFVKSVPAPGVIFFGGSGKGSIRCISPNQIATQPNAYSAIKQALLLYRDGTFTGLGELKTTIFSDFQEGIKTLAQAFDKPITVDLEWAADGRILCIGFCVDNNQAYIFPEEMCQSHSLHIIAATLATMNFLIGHNWKADAGVIYDITGVKVPVWFDTMVAHHSLHMASTGQHGLKQIAETMLGVDDWDDDLVEYSGRGAKADYAKIPRDMLYEYNAYDVFYTYQIYLKLVDQVTDYYWLMHGLKPNMLMDVEANRITVDVPYLHELADSLDEKIAEARSKLPEGINPNSPKQLKEYFASEGLNLKSTSKDVLDKHKDHPAVEPLLEYRGLAKDRSTYVKAYLEAQQGWKIKPNFNVHGTSTGRLSSSKPINAQNIPRKDEIQRIFIASGHGRLVASADYSQAELRVMACLSGDEAMQALFQEGSPDFFDSLQPMVYPNLFSNLEDFQQWKLEDPNDAEEKRTLLKSVVYGLSYGRKAHAIAEATGNTPAYAQTIIDMFLDSFPLYKKWREDVTLAAVSEGHRDFLVSPFGAKFESEIVRHGNRENVINAALAFLPQSTAGDLTTQAAIWANDKFRTEKWPVYITNLVHDAIYLDGEEAVISEAADEVQKLMRKSGRLIFGDTVLFDTDKKIGTSWKEV